MVRDRYRHQKTKTLLGRVWSVCKVGIVAILIFGAGYLILEKTVHESVQSTLQAKFNTALAPFQYHSRIQKAEFVEGKGFYLSNLTLVDHNENDQPLANIASVVLNTHNTTTDLVAGCVDVETVELRHGKFFLNRNANGDWNVARFIDFLKQIKSTNPDSKCVPIRFVDCSLNLVDQSKSTSKTVELDNIQLQIRPVVHEGRPLIQLAGVLSSQEISQLKLEAWFEESTSNWFARLTDGKARLSNELLAQIPTGSFASHVSQVSNLSGEIVASATLSGSLASNQPVNFDVRGRLNNLALTHAGMPDQISGTEASFRIQPDRFEVSRARGKIGEGAFDFNYLQQGLFARRDWSSTGTVQQLSFDKRLQKWLPDGCKKFCTDFSPAGKVSLQFELADRNGVLSREIQSRLTDMSFKFSKFPYPVRHCVGDVHLKNETCRFNVRSSDNGNTIGFSGWVKNPGRSSTYQIDIDVEGEVPIDERFWNALGPQPRAQKIIGDFQPTGQLGISGSISKPNPTAARPNRNFDIKLVECNVRHNKFDYPIHNVNGLVKLVGDSATFENVTGTSAAAQIRCDGQWQKEAGTSLRFLCRNVPLDERLRMAVRSDIKEVWRRLRPQGSVNQMRVDMQIPSPEERTQGSKTSMIVSADLADPQNRVTPISIRPEWFPYEINRLGGRIRIGENRIEFEDMKGHHDRAWLVCQGQGTYSPAGWKVTLKDLLVGSLSVDEDLFTALPEKVAPAIRQLGFSGLLNVDGSVVLSGKNVHGSNVALSSVTHSAQAGTNRTHLRWDLRFDMDQARLKIGVPIENMFGRVYLQGEFDGENATSIGKIDFDSITVQDAQITNLRGPIGFNNSRIAAGNLVNPSAKDSKFLSGNMFGGEIRLDGERTSADGRFFIEASLLEGQLADVVQEFAPHIQQIEGKTFLNIRLAGDSISKRSFRGGGTLNLREADIYELPAVLSLLKLLQVKQVNRTAFDSSNVDFTINGEHIDLNRTELIGDAISLIGNGQVDFNRNLNLNFYSVMGRGRFYVPMLSELVRAGSKRVLWIEVDGTLDNPQMNRRILPQLNDTIRQLFQPVDRQTTPYIAGLPSTDSQTQPQLIRR